jgi:hypothetical protein
MDSTPQQCLALAYDAYNDAFQRRRADLKAAATDEQAEAVLANIAALENAYLTAAREALDRTGPAIESAYQAALDAKKQVDDAYAAAKDMGERIALVGDLANKVGDLVAKASGANGAAAA